MKMPTMEEAWIFSAGRKDQLVARKKDGKMFRWRGDWHRSDWSRRRDHQRLRLVIACRDAVAGRQSGYFPRQECLEQGRLRRIGERTGSTRTASRRTCSSLKKQSVRRRTSCRCPSSDEKEVDQPKNDMETICERWIFLKVLQRPHNRPTL